MNKPIKNYLITLKAGKELAGSEIIVNLIKYFVILRLLSASLNSSLISAVQIKCEFKTDHWWIIGSAYTCEVKDQSIITDRSNQIIDTATGNHLEWKTNNDVKVVYFQNSKVLYFPLGLEKIFKNLEGISVTASEFKEIRKDDLKDYPKLRELSLHYGNIETIEADLFINNPNLEGIYLNNNKISQIDANVFNNLKTKLKDLYLADNNCKLDDVRDDNSSVNEVIAKIETGKCTRSFIEEKIKRFERKIKDGKKDL